MQYSVAFLLLALINQAVNASVIHGGLKGRTFDKDGKEIGPAPGPISSKTDTTISTVTVFVNGNVITSTITPVLTSDLMKSVSLMTSSITSLSDKDKDKISTSIKSDKDKPISTSNKDIPSSGSDKDKMTSTISDKDKDTIKSINDPIKSSTPATSVGIHQPAVSKKPLAIWQSYSKPESMPMITGYATGRNVSRDKPPYPRLSSIGLLPNGSSVIFSIASDKDKATPTVYFPSYLVGVAPTVTKVVPLIPYYTPSPLPNPTSSPIFMPDTLGYAYGGGWNCVPKEYKSISEGMGDKKPTLGATGSAMAYMPTGNTTIPVARKYPAIQAMYQSGVAMARYSSGLLALVLISVTALL